MWRRKRGEIVSPPLHLANLARSEELQERLARLPKQHREVEARIAAVVLIHPRFQAT